MTIGSGRASMWRWYSCSSEHICSIRLGDSIVKGGSTSNYVGVVTDALDYVLHEMARDLAFELSGAGDGRDWAADGYIIGGHLFGLTLDSMAGVGPAANGAMLNNRQPGGRYFPDLSGGNGHEPGRWQMPPPQLGVAVRPDWRAPVLPALQPVAGDDDRWLLGRSAEKSVLRGRRPPVAHAAPPKRVATGIRPLSGRPGDRRPVSRLSPVGVADSRGLHQWVRVTCPFGPTNRTQYTLECLHSPT
jgi:hypothetical protein